MWFFFLKGKVAEEEKKGTHIVVSIFSLDKDVRKRKVELLKISHSETRSVRSK